jgi:hypothetical protein
MLASIIKRRAKISREDAVTRARALCEQEGHVWHEPVTVSRRIGHYFVWTHAGWKGGNLGYRVNLHNGNVRRVWGPLPR